MSLFGSSLPKRVTTEEFKKIMSNLYDKLEKNERIEVEKLFRADLYESGLESGISQAEFDTAMQWLEENKNKHLLEENDIEEIKKYFAEQLKD